MIGFVLVLLILYLMVREAGAWIEFFMEGQDDDRLPAAHKR